jgi:hypothetical protein
MLLVSSNIQIEASFGACIFFVLLVPDRWHCHGLETSFYSMCINVEHGL